MKVVELKNFSFVPFVAGLINAPRIVLDVVKPNRGSRVDLVCDNRCHVDINIKNWSPVQHVQVCCKCVTRKRYL